MINSFGILPIKITIEQQSGWNLTQAFIKCDFFFNGIILWNRKSPANSHWISLFGQEKRSSNEVTCTIMSWNAIIYRISSFQWSYTISDFVDIHLVWNYVDFNFIVQLMKNNYRFPACCPREEKNYKDFSVWK